MATEVDARGLAGSANHQILHFQLRRIQRLFWGLINNNNNTIALIDRNEPVFNNIPWESVPGGTQSITARLHTGGNTLNGDWSLIGQWFLGLDYNFTLGERWGYLPVFSALDVTTPISPAMIHNSYIRNNTPASVSRAADFIAQEQFNGTGGGNEFNQQHTAFTARNSQWIYDRMEGIAFNDCFGSCSNNGPIAINGSNTICSSPELYTISNFPGGTAT